MTQNSKRGLLTCKAKILTPPVPCTRTESPDLTGLRPYSAFQAVRPAQDKVAPSTKLRLDGRRTKPVSLKTPYSVNVPSIALPRPDSAAEGSIGSVWCSWLKRVTTLSPTFHMITFAPVSTTSPAPSEATITDSLSPKGYFPVIVTCQSLFPSMRTSHSLALAGLPSAMTRSR